MKNVIYTLIGLMIVACGDCKDCNVSQDAAVITPAPKPPCPTTPPVTPPVVPPVAAPCPPKPPVVPPAPPTPVPCPPKPKCEVTKIKVCKKSCHSKCHKSCKSHKETCYYVPGPIVCKH